jgi:hypothetical protein
MSNWVIKLGNHSVINAYTEKPILFPTSKAAGLYASLSGMKNFEIKMHVEGGSK